MQLKDLPECAQSAACNLLADAYHRTLNKTAEAERIRDAFIAFYSEAKNAGTYENLKSAAEDTAGSIFSKKYSEHGERKEFIFLGPGIEEGKEPVIIDKSEFIAAHKTNDGVVILLSNTDKQIYMSGDAEMLMDQLRKELDRENGFKNMFVFAPKGIAGVIPTPICDTPMCKVARVHYMVVTDTSNEEIAINCNEILSIAKSGDGVKITFNNGMQEFVAMDYQTAVNAAWGTTNKG
ncbi:hypothetical protein [Serratia sp. BIGb0163]|uniref:hypothetical protein n=1 Tax=Serratia sp. BIGb0163 TaxID=2940613 RepID=UPI00216A0710|nr:hypothetical protein [Serratia sp. BIGb0163]MCS4266630.1 hypothetical protein [Serratia sp. BIGb0163]